MSNDKNDVQEMGEATFLAKCLALARTAGIAGLQAEVERRLAALDRYVAEQVIKPVLINPPDADTIRRLHQELEGRQSIALPRHPAGQGATLGPKCGGGLDTLMPKWHVPSSFPRDEESEQRMRDAARLGSRNPLESPETLNELADAIKALMPGNAVDVRAIWRQKLDDQWVWEVSAGYGRELVYAMAPRAICQANTIREAVIETWAAIQEQRAKARANMLKGSTITEEATAP